MTYYIPIDREVTFFNRVKVNQYKVIHEGLPFTIPRGNISVILIDAAGEQEHLERLVQGTVFEYEPRSADPVEAKKYDEALAERVGKEENTRRARGTGELRG